MRIGLGYDVHQLVKDRKLILGGLEIPFDKGLLGHSDADVLIHAIIDGMIGALSLGDIGELFPDNDDTFKNISSLLLLEEVNKIITGKKWIIGNIDVVLMAEKPKLRPFFPEINRILSKKLNISKDQLSLKATTTEKLGFIGREEGIACQAIVLLKPMAID
jgi:2-C-methyl-D-erythritol 2,4-cyclodiphosphate synthase